MQDYDASQNHREMLNVITWLRIYRIILTSGNGCNDTHDHRNIPLPIEAQE
jgi:hypothetical protein